MILRDRQITATVVREFDFAALNLLKKHFWYLPPTKKFKIRAHSTFSEGNWAASILRYFSKALLLWIKLDLELKD